MENWRYRCQSITIEDNTNSFILETLQFSKIGWKGAAIYDIFGATNSAQVKLVAGQTRASQNRRRSESAQKKK